MSVVTPPCCRPSGDWPRCSLWFCSGSCQPSRLWTGHSLVQKPGLDLLLHRDSGSNSCCWKGQSHFGCSAGDPVLGAGSWAGALAVQGVCVQSEHRSDSRPLSAWAEPAFSPTALPQIPAVCAAAAAHPTEV